jgi:hypothetical protein
MLERLKKIFWRPLFKMLTDVQKWRESKFIIPPYSEKRAIMLQYKQQYKCTSFIETGTFMGETVEYMKDQFSQIISIELAEDLANKAKKRFESQPHITILQGDSSKVLPNIVDNVQPPILYWLDGHFSGSFYVGDEFIETAKGDLSTPIVKELDIILSKGINNNVILIDDARLFVGRDSYPDYNYLVKYLGKYNIKPNQISKRRDIIRIVP